MTKTRRLVMELLFKIGNGGRLTPSDPKVSPVTIIGHLDPLKTVPFETLKVKLGTVVDRQHYDLCVSSLTPSPTDSCPLYMNYGTVVALGSKVSRHNTTSGSHWISKVVKNTVSLSADLEFIVLVTSRLGLVGAVAGVSRAFPLYSRKTGGSGKPSRVHVELLLTDEEGVYREDLELTTDQLEQINDVSFAVRNAAKLVDSPANDLCVASFVKESRGIWEALKPFGVEIEVIEGNELEKRGFGGIWNVGKGALVGPALVVLSHKPEGAQKSIAWCGKGIVFDTGGLSIKNRAGMCGMKMDCGGAAGVLYAFYLAVKGGFRENLHAILCLAENSVSERSMRVDDVITLYSGKTVEVNNTDAEGRLVLGDGVAYAKKDLGCDVIVDMATLTGAQGICTGKYHAAVLTNDEEYEKVFLKAGKASGDLTFPLVFAPELHFSEFSSNIADMKNSVADRGNAQSSCAGLFIFSHIGFDFEGSWVHVDMASPAEANDRATGYGVVLLPTAFSKHAEPTSIFHHSK